MKSGRVLALVCAFALAACNDTTGPAANTDASVLLEIEYINYAWEPVFAGFYLDGKGDIYSYDREGAAWPHAERSVLTEAQLESKFLKKAKVESIDSLAAAQVAAKIVAVNKNQLTTPKMMCADAGILTYRAYRYNAGNDTYEPVLLRAEGDMAQENTSAAAQDLVEYIRELNLFNELLGCDP